MEQTKVDQLCRAILLLARAVVVASTDDTRQKESTIAAIEREMKK